MTESSGDTQGSGQPSGYGSYGGYYGKPPAPKPGVIPLRPLGVGEILDGSFTAMRWNPKAILVPSTIVASVTGVVLAVATYLMERGLLSHVSVPQPDGPLTRAQLDQIGAVMLVALGVLGVYGIVSFVGNAILTGLLTGVVGQAALGRKETLGSAWRATRPRIGAIIGTLLLCWLIVGFGWIAAVALSAGIGFALGAGAHLVPLGVLLGVAGGITATVLAVWVAIRWSLVVPVVVLEGTGPSGSLGRSWRLVRGSWWRVFGILLLIQFIVGLASELIQAPFGLGSGLGNVFGPHGSGGVSIMGVILSGVGVIIAGAVTAPLLAGGVVLLYIDLRMRREGMDIALRSAAGDARPPGEQSPGTQPPGGQFPGGPEPGSW